MPNPIVASVGPLASAVANSVVASNTPAAAGVLALVGGGTVTLDKPRKVLVTFGSEAAARTIKIFGTNVSGNAINETLTTLVTTAGTAATEQDFATVTAVQVFAAWTAAMTVGTNTVASSPWFVVDIGRNPIQIAIGVVVSGTVNYTLEETYDDPNAGYDAPGVVSLPSSPEPASNVPPVVWTDAVMSGKTATSQTTINQPFMAFRITLNSGTGSVKMQAIQAGFLGA